MKIHRSPATQAGAQVVDFGSVQVTVKKKNELSEVGILEVSK